jgi:hypothetical protein
MCKINYITNINLIRPLLENFVKNKKNYYYNDLNSQIVQDISNSLKTYNNNCVIEAIKKICNELDKYFIDFTQLFIWNICFTQHNFMFNFPTTLGNIIFMPLSYVNTANRDKYIKTLIHEKIHIFQRYNLNKWICYILKTTNFKLSKNIFIENEIYNPDTFYDFTFVYNLNNQNYKGFLDKNCKVKWLNINTKELYKENDMPKHEHPFEILAYQDINKIKKSY